MPVRPPLALASLLFSLTVGRAPGQCLEGTLVASAPGTNPHFGCAVARFDDRIVVGAENFGNGGGFYVFDRIGGAWTETGFVDGPNKGVYLGRAVELDQDCIVAGDDWFGTYRGIVRVYELDQGAWVQSAVLAPSTLQGQSRFGIELALDGAWLAVGAPGHGFPSSGGAVFLYEKVGGVWTLAQELRSPSPKLDENFGSDLALQGQRLVVSNSKNDGPAGTDAGEVLVYELRSGAWTLSQVLPGSEAGAFFGSSIALDGDRILASWTPPGAGPEVDVWERVGGTWSRAGTLGSFSLPFTSLAVYGTRAAVASGLVEPEVFVFEQSPEGWHERTRFEATLGWPYYFYPQLVFHENTLALPSAVLHEVDVVELAPPIGSSYCVAETNSTGLAGRIGAIGSATVADGCLVLWADLLPAKQFGYLLLSRTQGFVAQPGGSQGNLCLGGTIGRFTDSIRSTGGLGSFSVTVDLADVPAPPGAISPGDTWSFQIWYRDANPGPTSNFTDGVEIQFL